MPALARYTNLHIKPALKGEVGFAQAKAGGVKKEESSLGIVNPSVSLRSTAPRKGEPFGMVQILTKSCPRVRGIRAERAQWAMQRGENRAE